MSDEQQYIPIINDRSGYWSCMPGDPRLRGIPYEDLCGPYIENKEEFIPIPKRGMLYMEATMSPVEKIKDILDKMAGTKMPPLEDIEMDKDNIKETLLSYRRAIMEIRGDLEAILKALNALATKAYYLEGDIREAADAREDKYSARSE